MCDLAVDLYASVCLLAFGGCIRLLLSFSCAHGIVRIVIL